MPCYSVLGPADPCYALLEGGLRARAGLRLWLKQTGPLPCPAPSGRLGANRGLGQRLGALSFRCAEGALLHLQVDRVLLAASGQMPPPYRPATVCRPAWVLRESYRIVSCASYSVPGKDFQGQAVDIFYNYRLWQKDGQSWKLVSACPAGSRGLLQVRVRERASGRWRKLYLHRLAMFNIPRCNRRRHPHTVGYDVHHRARRGLATPWSDSTLSNMVVWSKAQHASWHRRHPDVPTAWGVGL